MATLRLPKSRIARWLLVVALLLVANSIAVRALSDPLEAVHLKATELNGGVVPKSMLDGGYDASLLGLYARGRFLLEDGQVLELRLARHVAFLPWRLTLFSASPPTR